MFIYTAKLYVESETLDEKSGDDLEDLYLWMMTKAQDQVIRYNGCITNNYTQKVVRTFQSCSIE